MLKFQKSIEDALQHFTIRKNWENTTIFKIEYEFIKSILVNGSTPPIRYATALNENLSLEEVVFFKKEILKKEVDIKNSYIDSEDVLYLLRKMGINIIGNKENFIFKINELGELFLKMVDGDKESYYLFKDKYQEYAFSETEDKKNSRVIPLALTVYIFELIEALKGSKNNNLLIGKISIHDYKYLITDFQYHIGVALGTRRKKNALDLLEDAKTMVKDISTEETQDTEENSSGTSELERLRFERDNFKSSLLFIQNNFNELKEKIEEEASEAKKMSIGEFFVTLNSEKYGKFLDKVPYAEELLTKIRKERLDRDVPPEIRTVMMFIKQVIKFIKDSGIEPIEEYNKIFNGTADDIAHMNYNGEPFFSHDETKELKIEAPGYRYKDITISIPTVSEVKCDE